MQYRRLSPPIPDIPGRSRRPARAEEQLGAQVWPYVSITEGISGDALNIAIANDGLGPDRWGQVLRTPKMECIIS
jgi:hypothetical protein